MIPQERSRQAVMDLADAYSRSKVLRLGAVWMDSTEEQRQELEAETGVHRYKLKQYANRLQAFFPYTRETEYTVLSWTARENQLLRDIYTTRSQHRGLYDELEAMLHQQLPHRTLEAAIKQASKLGLTNHPWTEAENDLLRRHYPTQSKYLIRNTLLPHRTPNAIQVQASMLGIYKVKHHRANIAASLAARKPDRSHNIKNKFQNNVTFHQNISL